MPRTDEQLAAIVADPEFATFSAAQRAKILKDATKGRPPLVLQSSADPAPKQRSVAQLFADDRAAKAARRIDPMAAQRPTLMDELTAAMPGYETTLKPTEAAARQQRLAQAPAPGSAASIVRTARETVGDVISGGITGQMLLAPNRQAMEAFDRQQRLISPDIATRMGQQAADRAALMPPLVTQAARNQTASEQAGAMLRGARQMAGDFVEGVAGPVRDVAQEPSRLLPTSPGFAEGATAALVSIPTAMATDPVSDALFGGAGLLASRAARAVKAGAPAIADSLRAAKAVEPDLTPAASTPEAPDMPAPNVEKLSTAADMPKLPPRPEVSLLIEDAGRLQQAIKESPAVLPGARRGSLGRAGRDPSEPFRAGQEAVNNSLDAKVRELIKERKQADLDGNAARVMQIDGEIQAIDDARVVIPMPGETFVTIADLQNDLAAATAAGDTAAVTRLERQIRKARASNYHNPTKYSFMSQEATDKFYATLEHTAAKLRSEGRDPKTLVPREVIRRNAAEINPLAVEEMGRRGLKQGESLTAVEYEAAKNYLQKLVEDSIQVERRVNAIQQAQHGGPIPNGADGNPINPLELDQALKVEQARLHQLENDIMGLHGIVTQSRSQKGRDLAYLKMIAQQGWDTGYWLARANRTSGGVATSEQISAISQIVVRGQQADDALKRAQLAGDPVAEAAARQAVYQARVDLAKQMGKVTITPALDALSTALKAGGLTGVGTFTRNNASNLVNFGVEGLVNVIGAIPDAYFAMTRTGRRTTFVPRVESIRSGLQAVRTRGWPEAKQTMIHGMPLDQLAALDIPHEVNTPSQSFNAYVNTIMRFQGAQDRLYKAYAMSRFLDDEARGIALETANRTTPRPTRAQLEANIRYLAENPTEEMMHEAIAAAEWATFQDETAVSHAISWVKRALRNWDAKTGYQTGAVLNFALDRFLPYAKTPSSVGTRAIADFATPYAVTQTLVKRRARRRAEQAAGATDGLWMTPAEQRAVSRGIARNAIGSTMIYIGSMLYDRGMLTGSDQSDRREENMAAGRTSNAVKINGRWLPLSPFSPYGVLASLGATMNRDGRDQNGETRGYKAALQLLALMLDQPFTQSTKQFAEIAGDTQSKKVNRFFGSLAGTVVPSLVAEIARGFDPSSEARAIDYSTPGTAMAQTVQSRLPFARQYGSPDFLPDAIRSRLPLLPDGLPTAYTGLGDPRSANTGLMAFNAFAGTPAREDYDPIVREVLITGANIPKVTTDVKIGRKHAPIPLTVEQQQDLLRAQGEATRKKIGVMLNYAPYVNEESPDVQRELLNAAISKATARIKKRWIREHRAELADRQAQQDEKDRIKRGQGRSVVGPMTSTP